MTFVLIPKNLKPKLSKVCITGMTPGWFLF
jgi:hypothetical protein